MNEKKSFDKCKHLKEEVIHSGKWIGLNKITYADGRGKERTWESVCRTTTTAGGSDAVCVIAILKRLLKYDCMVLVKQYRPPLKCCTLEMPAGLIDKSESVESCAERELKEETGYTGTIKHISLSTCLDPGLGNTSVQFVTIEIDGDDPSNQNPSPCPEESEFIEVVCIPINELLERLNNFAKTGVVIDSRVYSYAIAMEQTKKAQELMRSMSTDD